MGPSLPYLLATAVINFEPKLRRCRFKLLKLRLKIHYIFIYRRQHLRIFNLRLLDVLNHKFAFQLAAMQTILKHLFLFFHHVETRQNCFLVFIAETL